LLQGTVQQLLPAVFIYRSRFLTRGEVWFDDEPDGRTVDWILYRQCSRPIRNSRWRFFYTRLLDLSKSPEQLLAEMKEPTVAKITQATEQDGTFVQLCNPTAPEAMDQFETMWNEFAAARKSPRLDRKWLVPMINTGALLLTAGRDAQGELLALQATYENRHRARQLMVVSPFRSNQGVAMRKKIHRANCLLHWDTILRMKERGIRYFDFGGWYPGKTDIELLGINSFKESFGGEGRRDYECERILTLKAWVVLTVARLFKKTQNVRKFRDGDPDIRTHATSQKHNISPALR